MELKVNNWYKKAEEDFEEEDIEIPENSKGGDCYQVSGRYIMDSGLMGGNPNLVLVHGIVTGQGPIEGIQYGHAWVEEGDICIDLSKGKEIKMPKTLYYTLGNIDPSKQFRYTPEEMRKNILKYKHWGPWDLKSKY
jgi:hypothetical protein